MWVWETVKLLLEQGYEVHITYRKSAGKAEELMQENPGRVFAHKLDQGNLEEIEKADFLAEHGMVWRHLQRSAGFRHCQGGVRRTGRSAEGCK